MSMLNLDIAGEETYPPRPVAPLPKIWIGFAFAFAFLAAEIVEFSQGNEENLGPWTLLASVAGSFYWLHCVSRFHKILGDISPHRGGEPTYTYSPRQAVIRHFIPFYNIYWMFKWPLEMVSFLRRRTSVKILSGALLGLCLFLSMIVLRAVDGFLGLSCIFTLMYYIARKIREAVAEHETVRGAAGVFA